MNAKQKRSIPPLFQQLPLILLWIILHFVFPIRMILEFPFTLIGLAPIIVGLFMQVQAARILLKNKGVGEKPTLLVTDGPYKYSRNPAYLGGIVFFFGFAILLGSLVSFVFPLIMFLLAHFLYIPIEEKELKVIFGEKYLDYMKHVRRWI